MVYDNRLVPVNSRQDFHQHPYYHDDKNLYHLFWPIRLLDIVQFVQAIQNNGITDIWLEYLFRIIYC